MKDEIIEVKSNTKEYRAYWAPCPTCGVQSNSWCVGLQYSDRVGRDKMHSRRLQLWKLLGMPSDFVSGEPFIVKMLKAAGEWGQIREEV